MIFQTIEIIIIVVLFLLQVYFCIVIWRKTKLISTFLPDRDVLGIDVVRADDTDVDMISRAMASRRQAPLASDTYDAHEADMSNEERTVYFNEMSQNKETGSSEYFFFEKEQCPEQHAIVELHAKGANAAFSPHGNINTMSLSMNRPFFNNIFTVIDGNHNGEDPVVCLEEGLCTRKDDSWQIVKKCLIEM